MQPRVVVLGAGFGGLELAATLSEELGDGGVDVTLIDGSDAFTFGFAKLDVLFGRKRLDAVRLPYRDIAKPGVRFLQQRVTAIDPEARRVTTDGGVHDADFLVVALGAEYDYDATPGLRQAGNEFYSVAGARRLSEELAKFNGGNAVIGVCGTPYKCTPAPSEAALLLHDHLVARGLREKSTITFVLPMPVPVPPSPDASRALLAAFQERGIAFLPGRRVTSLDGRRHALVLDDASELPFDIFLGVPKHRVPPVVSDAGLTGEDGYVPVDRGTLRTRFDGVYAIGDVTSSGVPKAGTFAEGQGRAVAAAIAAAVRGEPAPAPYTGRGACYIEFGAGRVGRVDVEVLADKPGTSGALREPSSELAQEKRDFGTGRRARWFGSN